MLGKLSLWTPASLRSAGSIQVLGWGVVLGVSSPLQSHLKWFSSFLHWISQSFLLKHMPLTTFFLPVVCASRTVSIPPLHAPWYTHTHFPILSKLPDPWVPTPENPPSRLFKWTVILVTLLRQGTSTRRTGDTRVFQGLAQNLVKWGQVCISVTLYILFGYLPLSPTDPPNGTLLKRPSATKAHTQWSKYLSFFPSFVSVTKYVHTGLSEFKFL